MSGGLSSIHDVGLLTPDGEHAGLTAMKRDYVGLLIVMVQDAKRARQYTCDRSMVSLLCPCAMSVHGAVGPGNRGA